MVKTFESLISNARDELIKVRDKPIHMRFHIDCDGLCTGLLLKRGLQHAGFNIASAEGRTWISRSDLRWLQEHTRPGDVIMLGDFGSGNLDAITECLDDRTVFIFDHHELTDPSKVPRKPSLKVIHVNPRLTNDPRGSGSTVAYNVIRAIYKQPWSKLAKVGMLGAYEDWEKIDEGPNKILFDDARVRKVVSKILVERDPSFMEWKKKKNAVNAIYMDMIHSGYILPPASRAELDFVFYEIKDFLKRRGVKENATYGAAMIKLTPEAEKELEQVAQRIVTKVTEHLQPDVKKNYLLSVDKYKQSNYIIDFEGKGVPVDLGYFASRITKASRMFEEYGQDMVTAIEKYLIEQDSSKFTSIYTHAKEQERIQLDFLLRSGLKIGTPKYTIEPLQTEHFYMWNITEPISDMSRKLPNVVASILAAPRSKYYHGAIVSSIKSHPEPYEEYVTTKAAYARAAYRVGQIERAVPPSKYIVVSFPVQRGKQVTYKYRIKTSELLGNLIKEGKEPKVSSLVNEVNRLYDIKSDAPGGGHAATGSMTVYRPIPPGHILHALEVAYFNVKEGVLKPAEVLRQCSELGIRNIPTYYWVLRTYVEWSAYRDRVEEELQGLRNQKLQLFKELYMTTDSNRKRAIERQIRDIDLRARRQYPYGGILPEFINFVYSRDTRPNKIPLRADIYRADLYHYLHKCRDRGLLKQFTITIGKREIIYYVITGKGRQLFDGMHRIGIALLTRKYST